MPTCFVELFFDLVFVFAVTQLSHALLEHFTLLGAIQTTLLLMAVWWVWIFTSWVTNWLDPETPAVRLMLFVLMLAGLVLSTSLPQAFGSRGLAFAAAYVFMQVGRSLFMLWALGSHSRRNLRNFQRITLWLALAGVFWIAGGLAEGTTRFGLWGLALFLEYLSPAVGFWVPGRGRSTTADWDVEGGHMAERCGLFIIIALGEAPRSATSRGRRRQPPPSGRRSSAASPCGGSTSASAPSEAAGSSRAQPTRDA
jgi:low temperature requirement protein LtrA